MESLISGTPTMNPIMLQLPLLTFPVHGTLSMSWAVFTKQPQMDLLSQWPWSQGQHSPRCSIVVRTHSCLLELHSVPFNAHVPLLAQLLYWCLLKSMLPASHGPQILMLRLTWDQMTEKTESAKSYNDQHTCNYFQSMLHRWFQCLTCRGTSGSPAQVVHYMKTRDVMTLPHTHTQTSAWKSGSCNHHQWHASPSSDSNCWYP